MKTTNSHNNNGAVSSRGFAQGPECDQPILPESCSRNTRLYKLNVPVMDEVWSTDRTRSSFSLKGMALLMIIGLVFIVWAGQWLTEQKLRKVMLRTAGIIALDVSYGKREALRLGRMVSLCPSVDGISCSTESDWSQGWLIYEGESSATSSVDSRLVRYTEPPYHKAMQIEGPDVIHLQFQNDDRDSRGVLFELISSRCPTVPNILMTVSAGGEITSGVGSCHSASASGLLAMSEKGWQ